jgi:phytoene desaturase
MSKIAIIGSGFAGLSAAAYLADAGHEVHIFEKNPEIGGRARQFKTEQGYVFDMGPSWYWMPGVFERFFADFGHKPSDFYTLKKLDPSFEIVFGQGENLSVPAEFEELCLLFETLEPGSKAKLIDFLNEAAFKYNVGMEKLVYKPGLSLLEFADWDLLRGIFKLQVFTSFSKHVRQFFKNPKLIALMEFPVLFLGAMPQDTPALYSLMNYAGLKLGTWYPIGGFGKVIEAMANIAENKGAVFHLNAEIKKIEIENDIAKQLVFNDKVESFDVIVASADYHHVETKLLPAENITYDENYWGQKTFAPSSLIFYLGVSKKIQKLKHHTLFFDEDIELHAIEIYKKPKWPTKPLFYVCCPSKTDDSVAPDGYENLFFLMPLAPGLEDTEALREKYFEIMMERFEKYVSESVRPFIDYKRSYCKQDFISDYHSYKGNAYGLANTLKQTANLKPKIKNKKIKNMYYAGQLTVPGPGVPPSIVSGKVVADLILKTIGEIEK